MGRCQICGARSPFVAAELALCLACIRQGSAASRAIALEAHDRSRRDDELPERRPDDPAGLPCNLCVNGCRIPAGQLGYCGIRKNDGQRLLGPSSRHAQLSWYHDPLPTNCVADWVCPGGSGAGHPRYAHSPGPEYGYKNLAVFFHACTFDCLFCQNWHFRIETSKGELTPAQLLASAVDARTSCICYFGGDPTPQLPFALRASKLAREQTRGRILRICWETNGSMRGDLLDEMMRLSLESGGCVKFDLKAWDEALHISLTGVTNRRTLENFRRAGEAVARRPSPPPLLASTLLVTGYIDEAEVRHIARFISSVNPEIPYALLGFSPHFRMPDLPVTPKALAQACLQAAREEGLKNVRLGNMHLLQ